MTGAEVKENINRKVVFQGSEYYLSAYILRKKDDRFYHQAELAEINGHTVYIVDLKKVGVINSE